MYSTDTDINQGGGQAFVSASAGLTSGLIDLLMAPDIVPGTSPGYQLCKTIFSYHPIGAILTDAPITRAQSKDRSIGVPGVLGEKRLVTQYESTWETLGKIGGTMILHNLFSMARMYGIASLAVGEFGKDPSTPLDTANLADADLYFSVLDPLNTAGSLVLNQNPNSPDFLKPGGSVHVAGQLWHPSRLFIKMNEQPLYIDWTNSAFGFVGRSVYQRALYPLKSFVQSMITDQMVTQKAGLLVYKAESPSSFIDNVIQGMFGMKRSAVKAGVTGQVLSIGVDEGIETLNMQNLDAAAGFARTNIIKNIASAAGMPASIILQEAMVSGLADGTEDMNKEVEYLNYIRKNMDPAYAFLDRICQRKAWTPSFFETISTAYPEYREKIPFETAFHDATAAFTANWPNLQEEPESKKVEVAKVQFEAVIAFVEAVAPLCDPTTKASIITWAAENCNGREELFSSKIDIDQDALEEFLTENRETQMEEGGEGEEARPRPFSKTA